MTDIAVVTGAAGALGAEVARVLFARGCKLVLVDSERGKARASALAADLGGASVVTGDIAQADVWNAALPRVSQDSGVSIARGAHRRQLARRQAASKKRTTTCGER